MTKPQKTNQSDINPTFVILFSSVILLIVIVFILLFIIIQQKQQTSFRDSVNLPFKTDKQLFHLNTNRLFNGFEDVDFVCISMEHRKETHFERLRNQLYGENLQLTWFKAVNGKEVNLHEYNLTRRYKDFFENNIKQREAGKTTVDYRGHLGCTISHLNVIGNIRNMTVIFEDDAEIVPQFREKLQTALASVTKLDPDWEILVLGWCCNYKDHFYCKENDVEPIHEGGIVKLHYWFGGWAYCIRNQMVAQKILSLFNPISWHIDLALAEETRLGRLKTYACMPTIANHAGYLRISSFDFYQIGDPAFIKTDTNF